MFNIFYRPINFFVEYYNMSINIIEISKIKKLSQLKKYNITKPIYNGNYLHHYLIIANNLTALKLTRFSINMIDNYDTNGFILAAMENKYDILDYFIKNYSEYIYNKNKYNENFVFYMSENINEYYKIIKNNISIDWKLLFQSYSSKNYICPLDLLFLYGLFHIIVKVIKLIQFSYSTYQSQPALFNLFLNKNLKTKHIIYILNLIYLQNKEIFNYSDDMGYTLVYPIVLYNDIRLVEYIVNKSTISLDQYSPISATHIFIIAYNLAIKNNNYTIAKYIQTHVMKNHNYDETDINGNNIIHFILKIRLFTNKGNISIEQKLLSHYTDWLKPNLNKVTPLDLLIQLDYNKYHSFIKIIKTDSKIKLSFLNKIKNTQWKHYIKKLKIIKEKNKIIKLYNFSYSLSNLFQARFTDIAIFMQFLKKKYVDLYIPAYDGNDVIPDWDNEFLLPDEMLRLYNNFPWLIIWNKNTNYWVHPYLNQLIDEAMNKSVNGKPKYKYAFLILSLRLPNNGLHATAIIYDFKKKLVERFDPYGNTTLLDRDIDQVLQTELTWNTQLSYIPPNIYFPVSGFQTISDENNVINHKMGDFGGYCLAWCFWYIEHRLANTKVEPHILIKKTLNRFMRMKLKPMEYIRNYANYLSRHRFKYLNKIGIKDNIASNENLTNYFHKKLFNSIIKLNK